MIKFSLVKAYKKVFLNNLIKLNGAFFEVDIQLLKYYRIDKFNNLKNTLKSFLCDDYKKFLDDYFYLSLKDNIKLKKYKVSFKNLRLSVDDVVKICLNTISFVNSKIITLNFGDIKVKQIDNLRLYIYHKDNKILIKYNRKKNNFLVILDSDDVILSKMQASILQNEKYKFIMRNKGDSIC